MCLHPNAMRRHSSKGQELVEFALIASIALIFLFGIMDWGIAFLNLETVAQRAAQAARHVSATGDEAGATNIIMTGSTTGDPGFTPLGMAGASIDYSYTNVADQGTFSGVATNRQYVTVTVSGYDYQMFTPWVGNLLQSGPIVVSHVMESEP